MITPRLAFAIIVGGAALLALEVLAGRWFAPVYGTGPIVWGALLAVTLAAMAVGYTAGGRTSRRSAADRLFRNMLAAAAWIALVPAWLAPALEISARAGLATGATLAAVVVLAPPAALLATLPPLAVAEMATVTAAQASGRVLALSTAGSVLGALVTAFAGIPMAGLRLTALATAASLAVAAVIGLAGRRSSAGSTLALLWVGAQAVTLVRLQPMEAHASVLLGEYRSPYGMVRSLALDAGNTRALVIDGGTQNVVSGCAWQRSQLAYIDAMLDLVEHYSQPGSRILVVGLGAGTLLRALHERGRLAEALEIDEAVLTAARRDFGLPDLLADRVHIEDARRFLRAAAAAGLRWDVVLLDAYSGAAPVPHLSTAEALRDTAAVLSPSGWAAGNYYGDADSTRNRSLRHLVAAWRRNFATVRVFDATPDRTAAATGASVVIFGAVSGGPRSAQLPPPAAEVDGIADDRPYTDDWNPIDLLDADLAQAWRNGVRASFGPAAWVP